MFIKRCSFLSVFQFKIRSSQSEVVFCVNVLFCVYLLSLNNNTHVVSVAFTAVCVCVLLGASHLLCRVPKNVSPMQRLEMCEHA